MSDSVHWYLAIIESPENMLHPPPPEAQVSAPQTRKRKRDGAASSGPKKSARRNDGARSGPSTNKGSSKPSNAKRARVDDEELGSEGGSDGGDIDDLDLRADEVDENESGEEDEDETPAEKRLRLARLYLESVKEGLGMFSYHMCLVRALT